MKQSNKKYKLWAWLLDLTATPAQPQYFPLPTALEDVGVLIADYSGNRSYHKFHWSNGISYKTGRSALDLSVPLFGNIKSSKRHHFKDLDNAFNNSYTRAYHLSGFGLNAGLIYHLQLNAQKPKTTPSIPLRTLCFGLTPLSGFSFSTQKDEVIVTCQLIGAHLIVHRYIFWNAPDLSGKGRLLRRRSVTWSDVPGR